MATLPALLAARGWSGARRWESCLFGPGGAELGLSLRAAKTPGVGQEGRGQGSSFQLLARNDNGLEFAPDAKDNS
jgi:hypothetical protein